MNILAIDPGNEYSGYVVMDSTTYKPIKFGKEQNGYVRTLIREKENIIDLMVVEMVASYGMPVGKEIFETCTWIGAFEALAKCPHTRIYRKDVKLNLCGTTQAKDSNIIQALKDRFGDKGTKKNPGWFYGFKADIWQAYALGATLLDGKEWLKKW